MAHRFSLLYPGEVTAVALLSPGSYTLPEDQDPAHAPLDFPFGVADLQEVTGEALDAAAFSQIPFWIGVRGADTNPADTAPAWDALECKTRVERAHAFAQQLPARGVSASLHIFSGAGHQERGGDAHERVCLPRGAGWRVKAAAQPVANAPMPSAAAQSRFDQDPLPRHGPAGLPRRPRWSPTT